MAPDRKSVRNLGRCTMGLFSDLAMSFLTTIDNSVIAHLTRHVSMDWRKTQGLFAYSLGINPTPPHLTRPHRSHTQTSPFLLQGLEEWGSTGGRAHGMWRSSALSWPIWQSEQQIGIRYWLVILVQLHFRDKKSISWNRVSLIRSCFEYH
jgi:hypothetical protein